MLKTKVTIPTQKTNVVHRERLIEPMLDNLHKKVIFVTAPAGYGKTTLATDFLAALDEDTAVAWYQIIEKDVELRTFFQYVYYSLGQEFPAIAERAKEIEKEKIGHLDPSAAAEELLEAIEQHIDKLCVLVLDDFHNVSESTSIKKFLEKLLELLPDVLRLVILSRTQIGLPIPKLLIRGEVFQLTQNELAFQKTEVEQLSTEANLNSEAIDFILDRTEGWAAALALTLERSTSARQPVSKSLQDLYDFLVDEVLENADEQTQTILTLLSVIDEFDENIARQMLEETRPPISLDELEKQNQFVTRITAGEGTIFRFHQLFREAIEARFAQNNPMQYRNKKQIAARIKVEMGDPETAVQYYLSIDDEDHAIEIMELNAERMHYTFAYDTLQEWFKIVSADPEMENKALNVQFFYAAIMFDASFANRESSVQIMENLRNVTDPLMRYRAINALALFYLFADRVDEANELLHADKKEMYVPPLVHTLFGARASSLLAYQQGNIEEVEKIEQAFMSSISEMLNSISEMSKQQVYFYVTSTLTDFSLLRYLLADHAGLETYSKHAIKIAQQGLGIQHRSQGPALNNFGYALFTRGRLTEAWENYEACLRCYRLGRIDRQLVDVINSRATLMVAIDRHEYAHEEIAKVLEMDPDFVSPSALQDTYQSLLCMAAKGKNLDEIRKHLDESISREVWTIDSADFQFFLGVLRFEEKQYQESYSIFHQLVKVNNSTNKVTPERMIALLWYSRSLNMIGDFLEAHTALQAALSLNAATEYGFPFVVEAAQYWEYISEIHATKELMDFDTLCEQIEQSNDEREALNFVQINAPEDEDTLEINGFGKGQVLFNGREVAWRKGSREQLLFFYILENPGISRKAIATAFWPDASDGKASSNVYANVTRLRQRFKGTHVILNEDQGYLLNADMLNVYDVKEFEEAIEQYSSNGSIDDVQGLLDGVNLYTEKYLRNASIEWVEQRREELHNKYLKAIELLAISEFERGNYEKAEQKLLLVLEKDPFREDAQLFLMRCYLAQNKKTKAVKHYECYKKRLMKELQVEPDIEIQEFASSLKSN